MKIKNCYPHIIFIGKQRTGKDRLILEEIYNMLVYNFNIFERFLLQENLDFYPKEDLKVYANLDLDKKVFPNFRRLNNMDDVENAYGPGYLWIHDSDDWFDSRDIWNSKKNKRMLHIVNNMAKRKLMGRFSCHRINSLDIKLRSLMNLKVLPNMVCIGHDRTIFNNWIIQYDVFNEWDKKIGNGILNDLVTNANFYNTEEEVRELII